MVGPEGYVQQGCDGLHARGRGVAERLRVRPGLRTRASNHLALDVPHGLMKSPETETRRLSGPHVQVKEHMQSQDGRPPLGP